MSTVTKSKAKTSMTATRTAEADTPASKRKARTKTARGGKDEATRKPTKKAKDKRGAIADNAAVASSSASPTRRSDTKQARLIAMLEREEGASIAEIATAFSWQAHTVRGAIAGALKKKLGLAITSTNVEGRGRVYRISAG